MLVKQSCLKIAETQKSSEILQCHTHFTREVSMLGVLNPLTHAQKTCHYIITFIILHLISPPIPCFLQKIPIISPQKESQQPVAGLDSR